MRYATLTAGKKNAASVTVPATIQAGGTTYKVTEIAGKAFSGNKKLTKLTIGKNVTQIGAKACYGCKKLAQITIKAKKLKTGSIGKNAFRSIANKAVVKCPTKALAKAYKKLLIAAGAPKDIVCK